VGKKEVYTQCRYGGGGGSDISYMNEGRPPFMKNIF